MKPIRILPVLAIGVASMLFAGCSFNQAAVGNLSTLNTTVELNQKNFRIVSKVSGEASAKYIFGFGGVKNRNLLELAKTRMLDKANLVGFPRAVVNVTYESSLKFYSNVYVEKTVYVSGYVVEFLK